MAVIIKDWAIIATNFRHDKVREDSNFDLVWIIF